tara:strand:+ start:283 stop:573 length:291 start_codon:yes stop_codon:yes gene_type:complete
MFEDRFLPVNRHIRVKFEKPESNETQSGVLLPDSFNKSTSKYQKVTILAAASDCKDVFQENVGKQVFVEKSMIQEIIVSDTALSLILENYVIGVLP